MTRNNWLWAAAERLLKFILLSAGNFAEKEFAGMDGSGSHKGKGKEEDSYATCKRCKKTYSVSSNTPNSCRYHPSFFVCRRHDDQKRYYELRADDPPYAAKFYDCCGAEDAEASGCTTDYHISYDDN